MIEYKYYNISRMGNIIKLIQDIIDHNLNEKVYSDNPEINRFINDYTNAYIKYHK